MKLILTRFAAWLLFAPLNLLHAADAKPPNVIVVITDDQGYGDLACHGNPHLKTPNLDRLHGQSIRLTDFHVSPLCTPTRAALMTGCDPVRVGAWSTTFGRSFIRVGVPTMADAFAAGGYRTALFGKWHLGDTYPFRPQDRGFHEVLCHGGGGVGQTPDYWGNDYFDDTYFRNGTPEMHEGYCTDVWFREALKFIEANREKPFFVYLSTNAPHSPYFVSEDYTAPYRSNPDVVNAEFNGMITNLDDNMGRLMKRLDALGLAENTILIFLTDNGTAAGVETGEGEYVTRGHNAGMRGRKGSYFEGGHRVPFFVRWAAGGLSGGRDINALTAHFDLLPTLIDLCGLTRPATATFDGISLAPLLRGEAKTAPERSLLVRITKSKGKPGQRAGVVLSDRWRLVRGTMLFDIQADPGQRNDIAGEHPDVVQRLAAAHDRHWAEVSPAYDEYNRIVLGHDAENPARLTAFDWHGMTPWHQPSIMQGLEENGFWAVHVARDGDYEVVLRRWPEEVDAPITAVQPGARPGVAIRATQARLEIAGIELKQAIPEEAREVVFRVTLKAGPAMLQTWLEDEASGQSRGAYFARIERMEESLGKRKDLPRRPVFVEKGDPKTKGRHPPRPAKTVLFIGDAVAAQYAGALQDLLKARVAVQYLAAPAGGKEEVNAFLTHLPALSAKHDLVLYAGALEAARVDPNTGKPMLSTAQFRQFLDGLGKLDPDRKTKSIWATSVPMPDGTAAISSAQVEANNRMLADRAYNRRAMLLDLHEYVRIRREDMQRSGDFLLTDTGVSLIASVVANQIEEILMEGNNPDLPNLLVLGDSIVGQYSTFLRSALLRKANVRTGATAFDHQPDWAEIVRQQVTEAERELGRPFELIQFNWGQHALKWMQGKEYSREPREGYTRCVPLDRYAAELETLVMELKKTGRPLMWAATTPANNGSKPDDAEAYNAVARQVMHRHQIPVNDLYRFVRHNHLPMHGCHFPRAVAEQLGKQVAEQMLGRVSDSDPSASPSRVAGSEMGDGSLPPFPRVMRETMQGSAKMVK